jgi:hypothetical protein
MAKLHFNVAAKIYESRSCMTGKAPFQCSLQSHVVNVSVCAEFVLAGLQEEQAAAAAARRLLLVLKNRSSNT